jgi:hypothetical protein
MDNSTYIISIDERSMGFRIIKDGVTLPFSSCQNIQWALQGALGVIKRTESEKDRVKSKEKT